MQKLTKEQISFILKSLDDKMIDPDRVLWLIESGERVCVGCGCSDNCACDGGCEWLDIDMSSGFGVCSECSWALDKYTQGNKAAYFATEDDDKHVFCQSIQKGGGPSRISEIETLFLNDYPFYVIDNEKPYMSFAAERKDDLVGDILESRHEPGNIVVTFSDQSKKVLSMRDALKLILLNSDIQNDLDINIDS